jgi:hypothetical protein
VLFCYFFSLLDVFCPKEKEFPLFVCLALSSADDFVMVWSMGWWTSFHHLRAARKSDLTASNTRDRRTVV